MMGKTIKVIIAAAIAMVASGVLARQYEGYWVPDIRLTKEKLSLTDPATLAKICGHMSGDGFYVLSLLVILKIDGESLQASGVGGGPVQTATLQKDGANTGKLLFRSPPDSAEKLEIEIVPPSMGAIQVRVVGRNNPELNALYWVQKSKEEITRMDADFLAGKNDLLVEMVRVCR